jgi:hypothetical protein
MSGAKLTISDCAVLAAFAGYSEPSLKSAARVSSKYIASPCHSVKRNCVFLRGDDWAFSRKNQLSSVKKIGRASRAKRLLPIFPNWRISATPEPNGA